MHISAIQCLPKVQREATAASLFKERTYMYVCMYVNVCPCLYVLVLAVHTTRYSSTVERSRSRACFGWKQCKDQCKSFAVAALHERLILLSPSLCARELFSCRKTEKVKKTLQRWGGRLPDKGSFSENISLAFPERKERERMAS